MSDIEPLLVDCGVHGSRVAAVVCQHQLSTDGPPVGFIENSSDPLDLQAWCNACEAKFAEENGLTEEFRRFNDFSVVCFVCYADSKARHSG